MQETVVHFAVSWNFQIDKNIINDVTCESRKAVRGVVAKVDVGSFAYSTDGSTQTSGKITLCLYGDKQNDSLGEAMQPRPVKPYELI